MARTTDPTTVVLVDDEMYNIDWMVDYLRSLGYQVLTAANVDEAMDIISKEIYRALIVDLNIPVLETYRKVIAERGGAYAKFPGLFVAERARNLGYRGRQVLIYSVHKDVDVSAEATKLGCTYILKGRPREIKAEIAAVVHYDPTSDQ